MQIRTTIFICGLALLVILTGCSKITATSQSGVEEPTRILNTYLQGLKDHDINKLKVGVSDAVYRSWPVDKKERERLLENQESSVGNIKNWAFSENPFFDPVNNQAIIRTRVTTDTAFYIIDFDMRKMGRWFILGSKVINRSSLHKSKAVLPSEYSFNKIMDRLNRSNYHKK